MNVMSSREFNQNAGNAKRMATQYPVFIADRGCFHMFFLQ